MATSEVYSDPMLISKHHKIPKYHLDNGIQAQLYTDQEDALVVFFPNINEKLLERLSHSLRINTSIWKNLTGISIQPKEVVIAYDSMDASPKSINASITIRKGSLLEVSLEKMEETGKSILGFVLSSGFQRELSKKIPHSTVFKKLSDTTDFFMNKNLALTFLSKAGIPVPKTHTFKSSGFCISMLNDLGEGKFILKPAGGAAGLGLFPNGGNGASLPDLKAHILDLESKEMLSENFQIQEFLPGQVWGIMGLFLPGRKWKLLQIHTQQMDHQGRFTGGRWTQSFELENQEFAESLFSCLAKLKDFDYTGLMEFDLIGKKIIEVNPRITASSPICHLLSKENEIKEYLGPDFQLRQIDINTQIQFPECVDKLKQVERLILKIMKETDVLILPQGINPLGKSRVLFVNDQADSSVQLRFLEELKGI